MKPLLFLWFRSFFNGIKRALTSGKRLFGLIFGIGYYLLVIIRPWDTKNEFSKTPLKPITVFPEPSTLAPYVFGLFLVLTAVLAIGIFNSKGGFKPADVDVLFPTPVSPKLVLIFRLVRDYVLTLLLPLFFYIVGWRGSMRGTELLFHNYPQTGPLIIRTAMVSWFLLALTWVTLSYAASLFVNRNDTTSNRNRWIIGSLAFGPILLLLLFTTLQLREVMSWATVVNVIKSPFIHFIFPTATASASLAMAPVSGNYLAGGAGLLGLIALGGAALWIALSQADWMYDQSAAKGFDAVSIRNMQRKGDVMGIYAERARQGKMRTGRIAKKLSLLRVHGPKTLLWKELILTARTGFWSYLFMLPIALFPTVIVFFAFSKSPAPDKNMGAMTFGVLALVVFMLTSIAAQQGFVELLRRVDVTKSLPFSPQVSVFWEVVGKVVPSIIVVLGSSLITTILHPALWADALAAALALPAFGIMLISVSLVITMLFPDFDDPTQRGLRSMLTTLALVICAAPPGAAIVASYAFAPSPLIGAIPAALIEAGITFGATVLAGAMYANYNPTE